MMVLCLQTGLIVQEKPCLMTCSRFRKPWPEIMASDHGCPRFSGTIMPQSPG